MIMNTGIYKITNKDYHENPLPYPALSKGVICDLLDSPARAFFNHPQLNPNYVKPEHERKFDLGSAVHDYVLEGGDRIAIISGYDDWKKKEAREAADFAYKINEIPLLEKQFDIVRAISESAMKAIMNCSELGIKSPSSDGDAELSYIWQEDGVWLKCRPDWLSADKKLIIDLKTTNSANPDDFVRKVVDLGYDTQSAMYKRGCKALDGHGVEPEFIFVCVEIVPPYLCSVVSLSAEFQELGNQKVESAIALWRHCLKAGKWPGYRTDRIAWLEAKPWFISDWESRKYDIERMLQNG